MTVAAGDLASHLSGASAESPPNDARAQYERVLAQAHPGARLRWQLDPGNVGLLRRALPELGLRGVVALDLEVGAHDLDEYVTLVTDEAHLVPLLPMIRGAAPAELALRLWLPSGRPYVPPPPALDLSTTNRCSLACAMCSRRLPGAQRAGPDGGESGTNEPGPELLAPEEIRALLELAARWGVRKVALTGAGEPFGDPQMRSYLRLAGELGLRPTVTTSGRPVTDSLAELLAEIGVSVSVSIHGATAATHDGITGMPGSWERAWQAVRRLVTARDRAARRGGLSVGISNVLQRANAHEVPALAQLALDTGCNTLGVQPINLQHGVLRDGGIVRSDDATLAATLWPDSEALAAVDRSCDSLEQWAEAHPGFLGSLPQRLGMLRRYFRSPTVAALDFECRAGTAFLGVDCYGTIKPCYRVPWPVGSVRFLDLRQAWSSAGYHQLRERIASCPLTCMNSCLFRPTEWSP